MIYWVASFESSSSEKQMICVFFLKPLPPSLQIWFSPYLILMFFFFGTYLFILFACVIFSCRCAFILKISFKLCLFYVMKWFKILTQSLWCTSVFFSSLLFTKVYFCLFCTNTIIIYFVLPWNHTTSDKNLVFMCYNPMVNDRQGRPSKSLKSNSRNTRYSTLPSTPTVILVS